jgi:S-formylglutathione hydrolase FrmB
VNRNVSLAALVIACALTSAGRAHGLRRETPIEQANRCIRGHVDDYTHNNGVDRRIWSDALCQRRDLYVYVPPGYDPQQTYPVIIWLHGFSQDEQSFLEYVVGPLDRAIVCGKLPPVIVAAPDGSLTGEPTYRNAGSFFINTKAGRFEDFVVYDVWNFVVEHYPIRPEPEAHVLAGVSMGGGSAYNLAIKHRDRFKVVVGMLPPLNTRWVDCHCRYMGNFDPCCWGWRTDFTHLHEPVGRFYHIITVRLKRVIGPLYDIGPETAAEVSLENPIEMIDRLDLRQGDLQMYVAYARKDQFNIDAQVESFLYRAHQRGLTVVTGYDPNGKHDYATAKGLFPGVVCWLSALLTPYAPPSQASTVP